MFTHLWKLWAGEITLKMKNIVQIRFFKMGADIGPELARG